MNEDDFELVDDNVINEDHFDELFEDYTDEEIKEHKHFVIDGELYKLKR